MKPEQQVIRVRFGPLPAASPLLAAPPQRGGSGPPEPRVPLIDIHEGPEGLILEADLPGVTESTLNVQLEDNVLSLVGGIAVDAPEGATPLHLEYPCREFNRSFILSDEVDRARITAELSHGVLRLNLPKAERARTRRIEVKRS